MGNPCFGAGPQSLEWGANTRLPELCAWTAGQEEVGDALPGLEVC